MIVFQKKLQCSKFKLTVSAEVMMNKMIDLMLQQILRTVLTAFWYPCIPVLVHVDAVRNEGVQVGDGIKHARDLDFMDSALGVTLATKACIVS